MTGAGVAGALGGAEAAAADCVAGGPKKNGDLGGTGAVGAGATRPLLAGGGAAPKLNGLEASVAPNNVEPAAPGTGTAGVSDLVSIASDFGELVAPKVNMDAAGAVGGAGASAGFAGAPKLKGEGTGEGAAAAASAAGFTGAPKLKAEEPDAVTGVGATIAAGTAEAGSLAGSGTFVGTGAPRLNADVRGAETGAASAALDAAPKMESCGGEVDLAGAAAGFSVAACVDAPKSEGADTGAAGAATFDSEALANVKKFGTDAGRLGVSFSFSAVVAAGGQRLNDVCVPTLMGAAAVGLLKTAEFAKKSGTPLPAVLRAVFEPATLSRAPEDDVSVAGTGSFDGFANENVERDVGAVDASPIDMLEPLLLDFGGTDSSVTAGVDPALDEVDGAFANENGSEAIGGSCSPASRSMGTGACKLVHKISS